MRGHRLLEIASAMATLSAAAACSDLFGPKEYNDTFDVGPQRVTCQGFGEQTCYQVRRSASEPWGLFYDEIRGFGYEPGFEYTIRVSYTKIENPPQDSSNRIYRLISVLRKTPVVSQ